MVSSLLALFVAFALTKVFVSMTGGLFGLEELLQEKMEVAFSKINGFTADVSKNGVEAAIQEQNISAILAGLVMKLVGNQENIPAGTTLATLVGDATAGLSVTLITSLVLFFGVKIGMRFLRGILKTVANHIKLFHAVDVLLGAAVGFVKASLIICVILLVLALFPNEAISTFLSKTIFLGELYANNPLVSIMGWML